MANHFLEASFQIRVSAAEAALLAECFEAADIISSDFVGIDHEELDAAKICYAVRSDAFRTAFPKQDKEENPFATFLELWSDPDFPSFNADLSIGETDAGTALMALVSGYQVDVEALACLIQTVCKSALPFAFEWAARCDRLRPGEFGGGYFVITETDISGGSTGWLMQLALEAAQADIR
ncbi:hypothetical protein [Sphingopyxis sp. 22461]|uniref:hypothetical protein n=1 Tax=Sphingopyxis sp. 22461 TaxID=3453923 RepID=UPI003F875271